VPQRFRPLWLSGCLAKGEKSAVQEMTFFNRQTIIPLSYLSALVLLIVSDINTIIIRTNYTNLYNARPTWLDLAHKKLDAAVCDAYGWPHDLSDEQCLE
jgi:hypothetical protein